MIYIEECLQNLFIMKYQEVKPINIDIKANLVDLSKQASFLS